MNGRRSLFGAAAALVVAPGGAVVAEGIFTTKMPSPGVAVTATPSPDAALIGWCAEFDAHQRAITAAYNAAPADDWDAADATADRIAVELKPLVDLICATLPTTLEGVRAVAGSLLGAMPEVDPLNSGGPDASDEHRLQVALLRGLLIGGAA